MEIELERTFLLRYIPNDLKKAKWVEILDIYIPSNAIHPNLRIRKIGNEFKITKKAPIKKEDFSTQYEKTIPLTENEFNELSQINGKRLHKKRYFYSFKEQIAQIDLYLDELKGLALADFEFKKEEEKERFEAPDFCLAEVTDDKFIAGGMLAGKKYGDIEPFLVKYNYKRLIFKE